MRIAREEVFGPVVSLIEFETFEEAIEIANSIDYGLSTSIYTRDVNAPSPPCATWSRDHLHQRSHHRRRGPSALRRRKTHRNGHREGNGSIDFYTTWKAVYIDYSDKLQRAQIDNAE